MGHFSRRKPRVQGIGIGFWVVRTQGGTRAPGGGRLETPQAGGTGRQSDLVWKAALPHTEKVVLLYLLDRVGPGGYAHLSLREIAQSTGLARRTAIYVLQRLRERGVISWTAAPGQVSAYQLNPKGLESLARRDNVPL